MIAKLTREMIAAPAQATLLERINDLHKEIDALVEQYVEECRTPGVPATIVKASLLTSKVGACRCAQAKLINETTNPTT